MKWSRSLGSLLSPLPQTWESPTLPVGFKFMVSKPYPEPPSKLTAYDSSPQCKSPAPQTHCLCSRKLPGTFKSLCCHSFCLEGSSCQLPVPWSFQDLPWCLFCTVFPDASHLKPSCSSLPVPASDHLHHAGHRGAAREVRVGLRTDLNQPLFFVLEDKTGRRERLETLTVSSLGGKNSTYVVTL